jgi:hypothetical protein
MNHRCSVRIPLRVEVDLFRHGHDLGRYMTRNIDSDGGFLETGALALFPSDIVKLAIAAPREDPGHVSIRAMVVRRTDEGVGLLFTNYSPDFYQQMGRLIDTLLNAERPTASSVAAMLWTRKRNMR